MDALISDYFKEAQGYETLLLPEVGFVMFRVLGEEFHVGHLYASPQNRGKGVNYPIIDAAVNDTAKERGCAYISCVVDFLSREPKDANRLLKGFMLAGFVIANIVNNSQLVLKKDIK